MEATHVVVRRERWTDHEIATAPRGGLAAGEAELRVDLFGFTALNLSYALRGEAQGYWRFFPTARSGWGRIPVWGFGTVVRSATEGVNVGERFYGYFPMSSHLVVQPKAPEASGFSDGAPHRRELNPVYNRYHRTTRDPLYNPDAEPQITVLRPQFAGAFFLADYLREHQLFDADLAIVSSASSKLACCLASQLGPDLRRERRKLIGLTAEPRAAFTASLGLYDRVIAYSELAALPAAKRCVYVDIAGSSALRSAVHHQFGAALRQSLMVGTTHLELAPHASSHIGLPGPEPTPFFVPTWINHRQLQWTPAGAQRRLAEAWRKFLPPVLDPETSWLSIVYSRDAAAVLRSFDAVVRDGTRPDQAHVFALSSH